MNGKRIITVLLLVFVVVSVLFLVLKGMRDAGDEPVGVARTGMISSDQAADVQMMPRKLVAYYFHGTKRCNTCLAIERQAKEALEGGFSEAMMSGRVEWRVINLDEPGNDRYYKEFQLTGSSLVLADFVEGKLSRFKVLQKTWDLVADPPAFLAYVQGEAKAWLEVP